MIRYRDNDLGDVRSTTIKIPPEAFAKFMAEINNPKPPTQALIDLMKGPDKWAK